MSSSPRKQVRDERVVLPAAWGAAALACVCQALFWQTALSESMVGTQFLSGETWRALAAGLGARLVAVDGGQFVADPGPPLMWVAIFAVLAAGLLAGGCLAANRLLSLENRGGGGWRWWWWLGAWEAARLACDVGGWSSPGVVVVSSASLVQIAAWTGFIATRLGGVRSGVTSGRGWLGVPTSVWVLATIYFVTWTGLNWLLWQNLLIPHGDSAMYEEHLWNLLHGKGFRSYLDGGRLFLGEHIQVIHLALVPLYVVWPSHLLLEVAQSMALAATAIPAYRLVRRFTGNERAAVLFAGAVLCYLPLQFLDIAIDFKTFRPNAFEIPLLLFGLDALEQGRYRRFTLFAVLALLCQEDAAPVLAPLGVWIALTRSGENDALGAIRLRRLFGVGLAVVATVYLLLVLKVILPWFRGGADVHFAQYFSDLGGSTSEIVWTVVTQPWRLLVKWCQPDVAMFAVLLLAPLGFSPLGSPGRLAVAAPLFFVLALNQLSRSPVHHFHAPLVPILLWSAAAGLGSGFRRIHAPVEFVRRWMWGGNSPTESESKLRDPARRFPRAAIRPRPEKLLLATAKAANTPADTVEQTGTPPNSETIVTATNPTDVPASEGTLWRARFACGCSLGLMLLAGFTPLGIPFWDSGSRAYWRMLYVTSERARAAATVVAAIPTTDRVASTDFIHPRFTHHARSYDYSDYRPDIPPDATWLVIDTGHPYSRIKSPEQVKEYVRQPREWELVPVDPEGWFLVFRRIGNESVR